jgi:hypothetical protein
MAEVKVKLVESKYQLSEEVIALIPKELLSSEENTFDIQHVKRGDATVGALDLESTLIRTDKLFASIANITLNSKGETISLESIDKLNPSSKGERACSAADKAAMWD